MEKISNAIGQATGGVVGNKIPKAKLGKNGPAVDRLGYGTMGLSAFYGAPKPDAERFQVLDKVYAEGSTFWDTADIYQDSEDLLGKWFKANPGKRENLFLATKFANRIGDDGKIFVDSTPEWARHQCQKSLERLGVSHIDLYYAHRLDGKTPVEKTFEELKKLQQEGKIKYIGISECSSESLRRACKVVHVDAVQIEYSPFTLDIENPQIALLKTARELGVAVVAYSPIGRGMLGGQIKSPDDFEDGDFRKYAPRFSKENFPKNLALVDKISAIAKKKNATPSQLTLAWLLAQGDDIFPIPGTTNPARVEENIKACQIKLTKEEEAEIRKACEAAEVTGHRYPEAMAGALFADTPQFDRLVSQIIKQDAVSRWQTLFGYTVDEAEILISHQREHPRGSIIAQSFWDIISDNLCQPSSTATDIAAPDHPLTREVVDREYLVRLDDCIDTAQKIHEICGLTRPLKTCHEAPEPMGAVGVKFCRVDGRARAKILHWIITFKPPSCRRLFILQSLARKDFDDDSIAPTLGRDATMPQFRLREGVHGEPTGRAFPVWYFFYGTLADEKALNPLFAGLGTDDIVAQDLRPASVVGGRLMMCKDTCRALVDCPANLVAGHAFRVLSQRREDALRPYETRAYEVVRCGEIIIDRIGVVKGCPFGFGGDGKTGLDP